VKLDPKLLRFFHYLIESRREPTWVEGVESWESNEAEEGFLNGIFTLKYLQHAGKYG
jgi:hypothetical protein